VSRGGGARAGGLDSPDVRQTAPSPWRPSQHTHYQTCFYCANMVETIISPAAVLASSDIFYYWYQEGCKDPSVPGNIRFTSRNGLLSMHFDLQQRDGLYYCSTDVYTVDHDPIRVACQRTQAPPPATSLPCPKFLPTSKA
jgi:hypothetical protein